MVATDVMVFAGIDLDAAVREGILEQRVAVPARGRRLSGEAPSEPIESPL